MILKAMYKGEVKVRTQSRQKRDFFIRIRIQPFFLSTDPDPDITSDTDLDPAKSAYLEEERRCLLFS